MKKWDYIYSSHNLIKNQNALILFLFLFVRFTVFFCFYFLPYIILNEVRLLIIIFVGCYRFDIMVLYYTLYIYIIFMYVYMCTCELNKLMPSNLITKAITRKWEIGGWVSCKVFRPSHVAKYIIIANYITV